MWARGNLFEEQLFAPDSFLMGNMQWRAYMFRQEGAEEILGDEEERGFSIMSISGICTL